VFARVFEPRDGEKIQQLGGVPILNSMASAEAFLDWYQTIGKEMSESSESDPS